MINKCRLLVSLVVFLVLSLLAVSGSAAVADDYYTYLPLVSQTVYPPNTTWATVIGYPEGISHTPRAVVEVGDGGFVYAGSRYEHNNSSDPVDVLVTKITYYGAPVWQRRFDGFWMDNIRDLEKLAGGDLIIAGDAVSSSDYMNYTWLARLDGSGAIVWQKFYSLRVVEDIFPASDGGFVIAGVTNSNELWMAEFDAGGHIQWQKSYDGPIVLSAAIADDGNGGFLVAGSWQSVASDQLDVHVLHLNGEGNVLTMRAFGDENYNYYAAHAPAADGGYFLGGVNEDGQSNYHLWLLKADQNGQIQWIKKFGDEVSDVYAIQVLAGGGCLVAGGDNGRPWLSKIENDGLPAWRRYYRTSTPAEFEDLRLTSWGSIILAGSIQGTVEQNSKTWLLKTDEQGQVGDCPLDEAGDLTLVDMNLPAKNTSVTAVTAAGVVLPGDLTAGSGSATQTTICRSVAVSLQRPRSRPFTENERH